MVEELAKIIRENDNPEQAVLTAIDIFTSFLEGVERRNTNDTGGH